MIKITKKEMPASLMSTFTKGHDEVLNYLRSPKRVVRPAFNVRGKGTPLYIEFNEKCAFCESKTRGVDALNYHHFRPSYNATEKDGTISKTHYIWLMYQWNNLYLVCNVCAKNKANNFPVFKASGRYGLFEGNPEKNELNREVLNEKEYPLIFDPCHYNPEQWFYYTEKGTIHLLPQRDEFGADRSSYTIQCLDLNREHLVEARGNRIRWVKLVIEKAKKGYELSAFQSENEASIINRILNEGNEEYCGALRFFVKQKIASDSTFLNWLVGKKVITKDRGKEIHNFFENHSFIRAQTQEEDDVILRSESLGQIRIKEIRIKGFRAIKDELALQFPNTSPSKENWLVLIGENGSGKSTILQAVYACLSGDLHGVKEDDFEDDGIIYIETDDGHMSLRKSEITGNLVSEKVVGNTPILGYGSIRMSLSDYNETSIESDDLLGSNLVNPLKPLINTNQWITERILGGDFDKNTIKESLLKLVERDNTSDIRLINGVPHIVNNLDENQNYDYRFLSTGFKQLLTIACDIINSLNIKYNDIQSARGIVLIDELENHLHPKWKMRVVGQLRDIFPLVQFIVATHEPLCINNLDDDEVILMKRLENGSIKSQVMEIPKGTRSSEILTGEWFGLTSTLDGETIELMENHRKMMYSKVAQLDDYSQDNLTKLETQISLRLTNSTDKTVFGIFKEEYEKIISDSVESVDFTSEEFREIVKKKLKSKLDR